MFHFGLIFCHFGWLLVLLTFLSIKLILPLLLLIPMTNGLAGHDAPKLFEQLTNKQFERLLTSLFETPNGITQDIPVLLTVKPNGESMGILSY